MPEPSASEVELATEKQKRHKSPGTDHIPAELIQEGGRTICSEINEIINFIWNDQLSEEWKESIILSIYKTGDKTDWL